MAEATQGLGPCRTCKQTTATWIQSRDKGPPSHLRPDLKIRRLCIKFQPLGLLEKAGDLVTQAHPPVATSKWHLADLPHAPGPPKCHMGTHTWPVSLTHLKGTASGALALQSLSLSSGRVLRRTPPLSGIQRAWQMLIASHLNTSRSGELSPLLDSCPY